MLWVALKLDDVVMAIGSAHKLRLRAASHPANVLLSMEFMVLVCAA
jgi:hypothetical protein